MNSAEPDWVAVTLAVLRRQFPLLPAELPPAIAAMVPVWGERVAAMDPSVRQEQLGGYSVTYVSGPGAWLSAFDLALLGDYRYPHHGSAVLGSASSEAAVSRGVSEDGWWL